MKPAALLVAFGFSFEGSTSSRRKSMPGNNNGGRWRSLVNLGKERPQYDIYIYIFIYLYGSWQSAGLLVQIFSPLLDVSAVPFLPSLPSSVKEILTNKPGINRAGA